MQAELVSDHLNDKFTRSNKWSHNIEHQKKNTKKFANGQSFSSKFPSYISVIHTIAEKTSQSWKSEEKVTHENAWDGWKVMTKESFANKLERNSVEQKNNPCWNIYLKIFIQTLSISFHPLCKKIYNKSKQKIRLIKVDFGFIFFLNISLPTAYKPSYVHDQIPKSTSKTSTNSL